MQCAVAEEMSASTRLVAGDQGDEGAIAQTYVCLSGSTPVLLLLLLLLLLVPCVARWRRSCALSKEMSPAVPVVAGDSGEEGAAAHAYLIYP
jgi:hypothetical protein